MQNFPNFFDHKNIFLIEHLLQGTYVAEHSLENTAVFYWVFMVSVHEW